MLTKEIIESKNFTYTNTIEEYVASGNQTLIIDEYLGLAVIEREDEDNIEFPVKLVYYTSTSELSIQTYYNNPKFYNEFFYISIINTEDELDEALSKLRFTVEEIDLDKLNEYE